MSIILSAKPDTALHRVLYLDLINHFISIIVLKVQRATLYHFYFLCKAVKFHIKQCVHTLYAVLHPPQTTVDAVCCVLCLLPPSLCFHACKQLVESCVSACCLCWRELRSITGWGCYPGAWAQPCAVISPHLPSPLWQAAQGRAFKLPPPENIQPFLYTLWKTNTCLS